MIMYYLRYGKWTKYNIIRDNLLTNQPIIKYTAMIYLHLN